uniref:Uncharacterized protein n=1 Tax=Panagrolaimus sp. PS1159 TaxID=55785 RepID=A0AC35FPC5_9BILA
MPPLINSTISYPIVHNSTVKTSETAITTVPPSSTSPFTLSIVSNSSSTWSSSSTLPLTTTTVIPSTTTQYIHPTAAKIPDTTLSAIENEKTNPDDTDFEDSYPPENISPSLWNFSMTLFTISFAFLLKNL